MRKAFTFYASYFESINELPEENKNELYRAIIEYSFLQKEPQLLGVSKAIWKLIKPNIDGNISRYENGTKPKKQREKETNKRNTSETEAKEKRTKSNALSLILSIKYYSNKELDSIFKEFLKVRNKLGAVNSDFAIKKLTNKLAKYDDDTKIKMIENSIVSSWKDVYEVKGGKKEKTPDWFDKEIETKKPTKESQKKIEDLLNSYS